ncbi:MAG: hypothetical protein JW699_01890 [Chitinispirillaceae bacterium]|nr:hypothetical protein [Chitinispirillaceae bacterium]
MNAAALSVIALAVVLAERLVLDRLSGRIQFSALSSNPGAVLADSGMAAGMLIAGAALAWPAAALVLVPARAAFCYGALLVAAFAVLALAAQPLAARRQGHCMARRQCFRAAAVCSLLGMMALVPQALFDGGRFPAFEQSIVSAVSAAAVFVFIRFLYKGIREHVALAGNGNERGTLFAELLTAGLVALACGGLQVFSVPG